MGPDQSSKLRPEAMEAFGLHDQGGVADFQLPLGAEARDYSLWLVLGVGYVPALVGFMWLK